MAWINLRNSFFFLAAGFRPIRLKDASKDLWICFLLFPFFLEFSSCYKLIFFLICLWNRSFSFLICDQLRLLLRRIIWFGWGICYRVFCKEFNFALRFWRSYSLWLPIWNKLVLISYAWFQVTRIEHLFESKVNWVVIEQPPLGLVFVTSRSTEAEEYREFEEEDAHIKAESEQNCFHLLIHLFPCLRIKSKYLL